MQNLAGIPADFADGESARIRRVDLAIDDLATGARLSVSEGGHTFMRFAMEDLREVRDQPDAGAMVLYPADRELVRITVRDPVAIAAIRSRAKNLRKLPKMSGALRRMAIWCVGAVASVALIIFVLIPALAERLAVIVPVKSEQAMGRAALDQIRWGLGVFGGEPVPICASKDGEAAVQKMAARLMEHVDWPHPITISVFDHDMQNAFALPGGQVVLFRGLIEKARGPEEVAGVLGHEIGHVVHRDPLRMALRASGTAGILGMVLGDFTGGAFVLILTEQLISASHSQAAETAADEFAVDVMNRAALPTGPFAGFFDRFAEDSSLEEGHILSHLASHPDLRKRAREARDAGTVKGAFEPVLTAKEWSALRGMCSVHGPMPENPDLE